MGSVDWCGEDVQSLPYKPPPGVSVRLGVVAVGIMTIFPIYVPNIISIGIANIIAIYI